MIKKQKSYGSYDYRDYMTNLIMMVGLPGSGKSTYAKELADKYNAVICSSDEIRKELFGNEDVQDKNDEVFRLLHKRIKDYLNNKRSVIYDATNINSKRRRAFLSELKNTVCFKRCIIMATPFEECLINNFNRGRVVPHKAIEKMYKNWNTPYWFEGWDDIEIKYPDNKYYYNYYYNVDYFIKSHMNYNQDNPHHTMTLGEHCKAVGNELKDNNTLYYAGLLHDCGKTFTKSFVNSKGEETNIARYYQHHCVGAYHSMFFKYPSDVDILDVSILINLHMMPYFWEKDNTRQKYKELWGDELYNDIMLLHTADKKNH